jgi:adenylate cyclase, class 2
MEDDMINVEIKARATSKQKADIIRWLDKTTGRDDTAGFKSIIFRGEDHQIDTYFKVADGRLKLREGNIENCLIQYKRPDQAGPKVSKYRLLYFSQRYPVKEALTEALGVLTVVDKTRQIYYLDNVKIHLDVVVGLGDFIEIEARDEQEDIGMATLNEQTNKLMLVFKIRPEDLVCESYSDMILKGQ